LAKVKTFDFIAVGHVTRKKSWSSTRFIW